MDALKELFIWTGISLLFGIVVTNAAYRAQGGRIVQLAEETATGALLREAGLFVYMLAIPFVALISGAVRLDVMALGADLAQLGAVAGFTFEHWMFGFGTLALVVAGILVVLWLAGRGTPRAQPWRIGPIALRDALYHEVHWTFYRAAPALWLNDAYWGAVIGFLLVMIEWAAHPDSVELLKTIEGRQYLALRFACLIGSAFLYLTTQNLWLMILANLLVQGLGNRALSGEHRAQNTEPRL
jgi:hypothetical protein